MIMRARMLEEAYIITYYLYEENLSLPCVCLIIKRSLIYWMTWGSIQIIFFHHFCTFQRSSRGEESSRKSWNFFFTRKIVTWVDDEHFCVIPFKVFNLHFKFTQKNSMEFPGNNNKKHFKGFTFFVSCSWYKNTKRSLRTGRDYDADDERKRGT